MAHIEAIDPWTRRFAIAFRTAPHPLLRAIRRAGIGTAEELVVRGRRSGLMRRLLITAIEDGGSWVVGHPNGMAADWVKNLLAAEDPVLVTRRHGALHVTPNLLPAGAERDRAVEILVNRVPFPISILYRAGRSHVRSTAAIIRLDVRPG
jgi:hypothetical protein